MERERETDRGDGKESGIGVWRVEERARGGRVAGREAGEGRERGRDTRREVERE